MYHQECSDLSSFFCHVLATVFLVLTGHIKYPATAGSWYVLSFPPGCFNLFVVSPLLTIVPQDKVAGSERSSLTPKHITPLSTPSQPLSHCLKALATPWKNSVYFSHSLCSWNSLAINTVFLMSQTLGICSSLLFNFCDKYHN